MGRARVRKQPDDALENLFEVEGRPDRRDDLVEEAFFDCCRRLPCGDPSILLVGRREWKGPTDEKRLGGRIHEYRRAPRGEPAGEGRLRPPSPRTSYGVLAKYASSP